MADEPLPAGAVSLEDDPAPAPAPGPPAEPPPPPVAAVPDEEPEPDQVDGLLGALRATRAENKALKQTAARVAELEQQVNQARPYVDFLRTNPGLMQARQ